MAPLNKNNSAVKRIMQEARELANDPSPEYSAAPLEDDIFEWHCTLRGPAGTEFEGGLYHFRILLPAEYPFRPPSLMMLTPSGRFETDTKICISFTSYHEELWQPAWGVRTAIIGLQGFFPLKGKAAVGVGAIEFPTAERKRLAALSRSWTCPHCCERNDVLLPDPVSDTAPMERPAPPLSIADIPNPTPLPPVSAPTLVERVPAPAQQAPVSRTRPLLLLDTAICVILVLACSIVVRRVAF
ncbi:UBC-like protein [Roridomyces roridus]|uniref:UBC-like protein n=1 Tax=Roridomyces roridus TaxID=1738132 RepID=A0AAD7BW57_9AGAR|nr:UBC-like protein [Roridomyces roridus]